MMLAAEWNGFEVTPPPGSGDEMMAFRWLTADCAWLCADVLEVGVVCLAEWFGKQHPTILP